MTTPVPRPPWTSKYKQDWDEAYPRMMAGWQGGSLDRPVVVTSIEKPGTPPMQMDQTLKRLRAA